MNLLISSTIIATLYGAYDFFIRLSVTKINPALGAFLTQVFSALTILLILLYQKFILKLPSFKMTFQGLLFVATAGFLIGLALFSLFIFFQLKNVKFSIAQPTILILRNLTVIILGILILKEKLSLAKIIGLTLSLGGIYLLGI